MWWAERGGAAQSPRSSVGFGAELCSLARNSLETSLDAGDGAAGVARFTLQEIEASVLLQDGLWGAAGVTSHVFFCRGDNTGTVALEVAYKFLYIQITILFSNKETATY